MLRATHSALPACSWWVGASIPNPGKLLLWAYRKQSLTLWTDPSRLKRVRMRFGGRFSKQPTYVNGGIGGEGEGEGGGGLGDGGSGLGEGGGGEGEGGGGEGDGGGGIDSW